MSAKTTGRRPSPSRSSRGNTPKAPSGPVGISLDDALENGKLGLFQYRLLLLCGLAFMCDALEVGLLSFIATCAGDEWGLSMGKRASITGAMFIGTLFGSLFWGLYAETKGRKIAFLLVCCNISLGGILSGFAPSYPWLLLSSAFVGFGIGGASIPFDLLAEFLPSAHRGRFLIYIEYFWTIGSLFVAGVAWMILSSWGWRALTFITAVPVTLNSFFSFIYLPESPKWLLTKGRKREAEEIVRMAAATNGQDLGSFYLLDDTDSDEIVDGTYYDLVKTSDVRKITYPLWVVWTIFGFTYYGLILFVARLYNTDSDFIGDDPDLVKTCSFDYIDIFVNASAEILGVFICSFVIDSLGRVKTQSFFYLLAGAAVFCMGLDVSINIAIFASIVGRMSIMGASCSTWVITPELYTTENRTMGHAAAVTLSKLAAFISPFAVTSTLSIYELGCLLGVLNVVASVVSLTLPETGLLANEQGFTRVGSSDTNSVNRGRSPLTNSSFQYESNNMKPVSLFKQSASEDKKGLISMVVRSDKV